MSYLTEEEIDMISKDVFIVPFGNGFNIDKFNCGTKEYNYFLTNLVEQYDSFGVSKTHLLLNKKNGDVIGYMTLSTDSIKLLEEERKVDGISDIRFESIPALKIGRLAVDEGYNSKVKGYGSFLIEFARYTALKLNSQGVACKLITVDADIEHNPKTPDFYIKNGFMPNLHKEYTRKTKVKSMRLNIFQDNTEEVLTQTGTEN